MTIALMILAIGLACSAFFSGVETGYYRAPRVRLVIDAVGGDRIARGLLWASNNPGAVVSTLMVGNNAANYLVSLATVFGAAALWPGGGAVREAVASLLVTPVVFVLGELLPKRVFLTSPYRLLRAAAPGLALAGVVLAPVTALLWLASRGLTWLSGSSVEPLRMSLRRRELADLFAEGHAVGLFSPAQRDLALATFALAGKPLRDFMTPLARQPRVQAGCARDEALRVARRWRVDALPVETRGSGGTTYRLVRAWRCVVAKPGEPLPDEPMPEFSETATFLHGITQLESHAQPLAAIRGAGGRVIGFVRLDRLQQALWDAE